MTSQIQKRKKLPPNRELFCQLYASSEEFFGNGIHAYAKAYGIDLEKKGAYRTAGTNASRLLKNAEILDRINEILDVHLNDQFVDRQLAFLIIQNSEYNTKLGAIKEYNALKKRTASGMPGQINFIQMILNKWGLDNVEQNTGDEGTIPQG